MRRSGVARDHDGLDILRREIFGDLTTISADGVRALRAVRNARRIAEVDDSFVRQLTDDFPDHGQAADAGVEDANGRCRSTHTSLTTITDVASPAYGRSNRVSERQCLDGHVCGKVPQLGGNERLCAGEQVRG